MHFPLSRPIHFFGLSLLLMIACETPVTTMKTCGDGFLDPGEECDGSDLPVQNCEQLGYYSQSGELVCDASCRLDVSVCASRCGDSVIQYAYGEECEDTDLGGETCVTQGLDEGTLRCRADCRFDFTGCPGSGACGDGTISPPAEDCEGGDLNQQTCGTLGWYGGELACGTNCHFDTTSCRTFGRCGDGDLQVNHGEQCEGSELNDETCQSLGYHGGLLDCGADCRFKLDACILAGFCGDATFQEGTAEECDVEDLDDQTCQSLGHYAGTLACTEECLFDLSGCLSCGDGLIQAGAGEKCDSGNLDGETCQSQGFYTGQLACASDCLSFDPAGCFGRCGDSVIQTSHGEACDGAELGGATCSLAGQGFGQVTCTADCHLDAAGCTAATGLALGFTHSCALLSDGTSRCWGQGALGRLGNGGTASSNVSVPVTGLSTASSLGQVSTAHTCAVLIDGTVRCWGYNGLGQLGDGSAIDRLTPVAVTGLSGVTHVATGYDFTCARLSGGGVRCWGNNNNGQLGNGSTTASLSPVTVTGISSANGISTGFIHACVALTSGELRCWGNNYNGQLGNNSHTNASSPVTVSGISNAARVSAGEHHTCALLATGGVKCWGQNDAGQLGHGDTVDASVPVETYAGTAVAHLACGQDHCCVVENSGGVSCWGANADGQIGNGLTTNRTTPAAVSGLTSATRVDCGGRHTCALLATGSVLCWGGNDHGQLGDGTFTGRLTPVPTR